MAKFDGKQIIGLLGGLVFKKGTGNTTIVSTKAETVKQTKATKEAGKVFGKASTLAKTMRMDLFQAIHDDWYDGKMINRLNNLTRGMLYQCYDKGTKKFNFKQDSFERLQGFEFNANSPITRNLWVNPELDLRGNQLTVRIPEMKIPEHLKFHASANTCEIRVVLAMYVLEQALHHYPQLQSLEVKVNQEIVTAQEFNFEVPEGCLCIVGMNLFYTSRHENIQTVVNNKSFNPAAICGAILTPGTFILPAPVRTATGFQGPKWHEFTESKF